MSEETLSIEPEEVLGDKTAEQNGATFLESLQAGVKEHPLYAAIAAIEVSIVAPMLVNEVARQMSGGNPLEQMGAISHGDALTLGAFCIGMAVTAGVTAGFLSWQVMRDGKRAADSNKRWENRTNGQ